MEKYRGDIFGAGFYAGHKDSSARSAEQILPLVFDLASPSCVVDVGCGTGSWLAIARTLGVDTILGIDGAWVPENLLSIPAECFLKWDLSRPLQLEGRRFDLAICMEVAEHLDVQYADSLIADLCALSDVVLFSASIPGQPGIGRRNEQWPPYWRYRFQQRGYELVDCLRSRLWSDDRVEPWYAQNAFLYVHSDRLDVDSRLRKAAAETGQMPLCAVHPGIFSLRSKPLNPPNPEPIEQKSTPRQFVNPIQYRPISISDRIPYVPETLALMRRYFDSIKAPIRQLVPRRFIRSHPVPASESSEQPHDELREKNLQSVNDTTTLAESGAHSFDGKKLPTLAICTTVLNPDSCYPVWLDYHERHADLIIVFIHDHNERALFEKMAKHRKVLILDSLGDGDDMSPSGLVSRQKQNLQMAIDLCTSIGIDWLLHLDADEILYDNSDGSWRNSDAGQLTFTNQEAVPLDHHVENYFAECTVFRDNGSHENFMGYWDGKSAVKIGPRVYPTGPGTFAGYVGEHQHPANPIILHYPNPSFDRWVRKYTQLGQFSDFWWDDPNQPNPMKFMLRSRDLVHEAMSTDNWDKAREYFNSYIPSPDSLEELLQSGELRKYFPPLPEDIIESDLATRHYGQLERIAEIVPIPAKHPGAQDQPGVEDLSTISDPKSSMKVSLRNLIEEKLTQGDPIESIIEYLVNDDFDKDTAIAMVHTVLGGEIPGRLPYEYDPMPVLPDRIIHAHDRAVYSLFRIQRPQIILFDNVLSAEECDKLIELAKDRVMPSTILDDTGHMVPSKVRTSESYSFEDCGTPFIDQLDRRVSALMNWPLENGESLQVARYAPGGQYKTHVDYFLPEDSGSEAYFTRGGQRTATLIVYLNDVEDGGETVFPEAGISFSPRRGQAAYFRYFNNRGQLDPTTRHIGAPVLAGEKWIMTKWMRRYRFPGW